jgi:hypothetical protein
MHPLVAGQRGALYAMAWLPVAGMLTLYLRQGGGCRWLEAVALALPLTGVFAAIALSAWYLCRIAPLGSSNPVRIVVTPLMGALIAAAIWVGMGKGLAIALASTNADWTGLDEKLLRVEPVLWSIAVLLYLLAVSVSYLIAEIEAVRQAKEAELRALRDQINPHFLFNSLNSISALAGVDKGKAREMCALLADFFRLSLGIGEKRFIALDEELAMVRHYLAIERVRFGERLRWEEVLEAGAGKALVPPLLLQPLVENAVKYGVAQAVDGGVIRIEARSGERDLTIVIRNSFDADAVLRKGAGVGLNNIRKRLETLYGGGAFLTTEAKDGEFRAEVRMWKRIEDAR